MSKRSSSAGIALAILAGVIVAYLAVFIWEYTSIAPWIGTHNSWNDGLWHGVFAGPNFLVNFFSGHAGSPLVATGGGGWYNFWFLLGIGAILGGGSRSMSSRRN